VNLGAFIGPICTLGLLDYLTRSLAGSRKSDLGQAWQAWVIMTLAACVGAISLVLFVSLSGLQLGSPFVVAAAVGTVLLTPTQGLLLTVLRGHERMGLFAAINSIGAAATGLVPLVVLVVGGGIDGYAIALLLVNITAVVVGWWKSGVRLPRVRISLRMLLALVQAGLPFLGWTLTMTFYGQVNGILLGLLAPSHVVGWYAAASRIVSIPMFVPALIVTPLLPALTRSRGDSDAFRHALNTSLRATVLLTLPFCAATVAAAPAIPSFLGWPADFSPASTLIVLLGPQLTIVALDMMLGTTLIALGLEHKWLVVGLVACVVSPAWNMVAIPFTQNVLGNGGVGAALGSILTECVMLVGALVLIPRGILSRSVALVAVRTVLAALPFIVITRLLLSLDVWLPVALAPGSLAFAAGVVILRVITLSELRVAANLGLRMTQSRFSRA